MELSKQQEAAERAVRYWLEAHQQKRPGTKQVFRLFGAAGTGKTTIARLLCSGVARGVVGLAPTGKAAAVLTGKGIPCRTVHQVIYQPMDAAKSKIKELQAEEAKVMRAIQSAEGPALETLKDELRTVRQKIREEEAAMDRPFFALKTESDLGAVGLGVLDECSMPDEQMGVDLLSFGTPILALGDPYQLPPIRGAGFFTQVEPDFLLTEVHRQAADSPILAAATKVRNGQGIGEHDSASNEQGRLLVLNGRPRPEQCLAADQLLCGRNATRIALNRRVRELRGRVNPLPEPGDRLVCLRNDHDAGLLNGTIWECVSNWGSAEHGKVLLSIRPEDGGPEVQVECHEGPFLGQDVPKWQVRDAQMFDYGYALTVHKAQGSQWDNVVLFDDWSGADRRQWLYTGITRAAKALTIAR